MRITNESKTMRISKLKLRKIIREVASEPSHTSQLFWEARSLETGEFPELGTTNFSDSLVPIEEWLSQIPFASTIERRRIEMKIYNEFEQYSADKELGDYDGWNVTVYLNKNSSNGWSVDFNVSD